MKRRAALHRWHSLTAPALPFLAVATLGLALACVSTGTAKPQASAPERAAAPAPVATGTPAPGATVPAPTAGAKPTIEVVGGETFSFGAFWPGDPLKHSFVLKNTGDVERKILRVQPG